MTTFLHTLIYGKMLRYCRRFVALDRIKSIQNSPGTVLSGFPTRPNDLLLEQIRTEYSRDYRDYTRTVSPDNICVSLEQAALLAYLLRKSSPARVLDTGSGFSSFVLRKEAAPLGLQCCTVEDSGEWLDKTRQFLSHRGIDTSEMFTWEEFAANPSISQFDLIFHDMGGMSARVFSLREVASRLAPEGTLILDDMQFETLSLHAQNLFSKGWHLQNLIPLTLDKHLRFAYAARRSHPGAAVNPAYRGSYQGATLTSAM